MGRTTATASILFVFSAILPMIVWAALSIRANLGTMDTTKAGVPFALWAVIGTALACLMYIGDAKKRFAEQVREPAQVNLSSGKYREDVIRACTLSQRENRLNRQATERQIIAFCTCIIDRASEILGRAPFLQCQSDFAWCFTLRHNALKPELAGPAEITVGDRNGKAKTEKAEGLCFRATGASSRKETVARRAASTTEKA